MYSQKLHLNLAGPRAGFTTLRTFLWPQESLRRYSFCCEASVAPLVCNVPLSLDAHLCCRLSTLMIKIDT